MFVDAADDRDRPLRFCSGTERGGRDEVGRALQPAPRIVAVVAVLRDACHRQRVQRLQQERPQATDEHRRIGVDPADRGALHEPPLAGRIEQLGGALGTAVAHDTRSNLVGQPVADRVARHLPIVAWPVVTLRAVMEEPPRDEPEALVAADGSS